MNKYKNEKMKAHIMFSFLIKMLTFVTEIHKLILVTKEFKQKH